MSRERKREIVAFGFVCFGLMIFYGDEASAAVAWRNGFLHSLGTLIIAGIGSGTVTVLLWCVYSGFKTLGKWGRLLIAPWIALSIWRYPYVLKQDWPETNPNPEGTAAFYAVFEAAAAVFVATAVATTFYDLYSARRARRMNCAEASGPESLRK